MTVSPIPPTSGQDVSSEHEANQPADRSRSIAQIYQSPTCTLEISANSSPLERWTRKPTLKNLRFSLRLEDPKVSDDQWVVLRGDRLKLEALSQVVGDYVQQFLNQSQALIRDDLAANLTPPLPLPDASGSDHLQGLALHPKGLLAHTLTLGSLASETIGESLNLTSTQLADLASVLDEQSQATVVLPVLNRDFAWTRSPAVWGKIAASTLISLGLTATVLRQIDRSPSPTTVATTANSSDQRAAPVPLPSPSSALPPQSLPNGLPAPVGNAAPPNPPAGSMSSVPVDAGSSSDNAPAGDPPKASKSQGGTGSQQDPSPKKVEIPVAGTPSSQPKPGVSPSTAPAEVVIAARQPQTAESGVEEAGDPPPPSPSLTSRSPSPEALGNLESQIAERWKPSSAVTQDVTYLVTVDEQGKITNAEGQGPTNPEAQAIVDATKGTSVGESGPYKLRVVFSPGGGKVKVYNAGP